MRTQGRCFSSCRRYRSSVNVFVPSFTTSTHRRRRHASPRHYDDADPYPGRCCILHCRRTPRCCAHKQPRQSRGFFDAEGRHKVLIIFASAAESHSCRHYIVCQCVRFYSSRYSWRQLFCFYYMLRRRPFLFSYAASHLLKTHTAVSEELRFTQLLHL